MTLIVHADADELVPEAKIDVQYTDENGMAVFPFGKAVSGVMRWASRPESDVDILNSSLDGASLFVDGHTWTIVPRLEFMIRGEPGQTHNYRTWIVEALRE